MTGGRPYWAPVPEGGPEVFLGAWEARLLLLLPGASLWAWEASVLLLLPVALLGAFPTVAGPSGPEARVCKLRVA